MAGEGGKGAKVGEEVNTRWLEEQFHVLAIPVAFFGPKSSNWKGGEGQESFV